MWDLDHGLLDIRARFDKNQAKWPSELFFFVVLKYPKMDFDKKKLLHRIFGLKETYICKNR